MPATTLGLDIQEAMEQISKLQEEAEKALSLLKEVTKRVETPE